MMHKQSFLRLALMLTLVNAVAMVEATAGLPLCFEKEHCARELPVWAHPDDYCGKRFPCLAGQFGCRRCDDHCRKGIPCLSCLPQTYRCNDYCRKCPPVMRSIRIICPGCASFCGEGDGCGSGGTSSSHR